jgi:GT2 family glycosyltransferase
MSENTEKLIPIIILNWNGEVDTLECLNSIKQCKKSGFFPVVIDNGSTPESITRLRNKCGIIYNDIQFFNKSQILSIQNSMITGISDSLREETLIFIENGENLGFAKGNNIGIKFAELIQAEWVMLLNNDTVVHENSFFELRKFISSNPGIKAITPQIRYFEPNTKVWNCGGELTFWGSRKYYFANSDQLVVPQTGYRNITFITGCALLFKFNETGPLTEKFFFGEEDYEFSLRMKNHGMNMACVFNSIIYHKVGSSINKLSRYQKLIYIQFISRLIDTRNYYSFLRWQITKVLCYLYIPVLLLKKSINPLISLQLIRRINFYINHNNKVDITEYTL